MKKITLFALIFSTLLGSNIVQAQSVGEVVRYATEQLNGSARYQAMGGAFGALGGDLSAISNNPAGSTVFAFNEAGATIGVQSFSTDTNYLGGFSNTEKSSFDISQAGFIIVLANPSSKWDKVAFGFNTQTVNNFNKNRFAQGTNNQNGLVDYFSEMGNVTLDNEIPNSDFNLSNSQDYEYSYWGSEVGQYAQHAYMALDTRLIEYFEPDNALPYYGYYDSKTSGIDQFHELNTIGGQQIYNLNFSGRYMKKLSLGFNLNIFSIDYTEFKHTSDLYNDNASFLRQVDFIQDLNTFGTGVSFQFGAIFKATEMLRLGLNYNSPTYYELEDEYSESLDVRYNENFEGQNARFISPNVINIAGPYKIKTAAKIQGSAALILGKKGLLSLDYGQKNYGSSSVTLPRADDTNALNNEISNALDDASYLRVGGEGRIGDLSLRAGYWQEDSPYKNKEIIDDFSGYSLGLGIRFGSGSLDLAYTKSSRKYAQQLYYTGLTDSFNANENMGQVLLTYNVRF